LKVCRPLGIEIYKVDKSLLAGWEQSKSSAYSAYKGDHGMPFPKWEEQADTNKIC
jgi:hypothetical protein